MTKPSNRAANSNLPPIGEELISSIRTTVLIHHQMFMRLIDQGGKPSTDLIELLEDTGNTYIDYSETLAKNLHLLKG